MSPRQSSDLEKRPTLKVQIDQDFQFFPFSFDVWNNNFF